MLHIGARKTATSSLQRSLRMFSEDDRTLFWFGGGYLLGRVTGFYKAKADEKDNSIALLKNGLNESTKNIIFSSEAIYQMNLSQQEILIDVLSQYCDTLEIVFISRNFADLAVSETRQRIREQRLDISNPLHLHMTSWMSGPLANGFPNRVFVRDYDQIMDKNGNAVPEILRILGVQHQHAGATTFRRNRSGSRIASQLALRLQNILLREGVAQSKRKFRSFHNFLEQKFPLGLHEPIDRNFARYYLADHSEELNLLKDGFGITYPQTPGTNLQIFTDYLDDLDEEMATRLLRNSVPKEGIERFKFRSLDSALLSLYQDHESPTA